MYSQISHEVIPDGVLGLFFLRELQSVLIFLDLLSDFIQLFSSAALTFSRAVLLAFLIINLDLLNYRKTLSKPGKIAKT